MGVIEDWDPIGSNLELDALVLFAQRQDKENNILWCQLWTVQENNPRTNGKLLCSLHPTREAIGRFVQQYRAAMPDSAPDCYLALMLNADFSTVEPFRVRVDPKCAHRIWNTAIGMWSTTVPTKTTEAICIIPQKDLTSLVEGMMET